MDPSTFIEMSDGARVFEGGDAKS